MPETYNLISRTTLDSSQNTIDFENIPSTYTDLSIFVTARVDYSNEYGYGAGSFKINNSSSSEYNNIRIVSYSSTAVTYISNNQTSFSVIYNAANSTNNIFSNQSIYIPNYSGSSNKNIFSETTIENNSATDHFFAYQSFLWSNNSAINRLTFIASTGNFVSGTNISLFGITKS